MHGTLEGCRVRDQAVSFLSYAGGSLVCVWLCDGTHVRTCPIQDCGFTLRFSCLSRRYTAAVFTEPSRSHNVNMSASGSARRSTNPGSSALALQQARFRPWEQQDLLHRLHTFKPRTWFGKPAHINALVCARHGWINHGADKLSCEVKACQKLR